MKFHKYLTLLEGKYKLPFQEGDLILNTEDEVLGYESKYGFISKATFSVEFAEKVEKFLLLLKKREEIQSQLQKIEAEINSFLVETRNELEYEEIYY